MPSAVHRSADRGFSRQACSSCWMYADSSSCETLCGSRQGTGGSDEGVWGTRRLVVLATSALDMIDLCLVYRLRFEHEFRIAERAHFRDVEAFELRLRGHAMAPDRFDERVQHETEREDEADERRDADQLRDELSHVAVVETRHRPHHTVPRAAVVALAVGQEPDRDDARYAVGAVDRNRADHVIHFHDAFEEL